MSNAVTPTKSQYRTRRPRKYVLYEQACRVSPLSDGSGPVIECRESESFYVYGFCRKKKLHWLYFSKDVKDEIVRVPEGDKCIGYGFIRVDPEQYRNTMAQAIAEARLKPKSLEFSVTDLGRSVWGMGNGRRGRRKFRGIPVIWDFTVPE